MPELRCPHHQSARFQRSVRSRVIDLVAVGQGDPGGSAGSRTDFGIKHVFQRSKRILEGFCKERSLLLLLLLLCFLLVSKPVGGPRFDQARLVVSVQLLFVPEILDLDVGNKVYHLRPVRFVLPFLHVSRRPCNLFFREVPLRNGPHGSQHARQRGHDLFDSLWFLSGVNQTGICSVLSQPPLRLLDSHLLELCEVFINSSCAVDPCLCAGIVYLETVLADSWLNLTGCPLKKSITRITIMHFIRVNFLFFLTFLNRNRVLKSQANMHLY